MKIDFVFVLNLNIFIRKKRQKNARFMDNAFKNKGHYIFQCWDLDVVCHPYENFWLRASNRVHLFINRTSNVSNVTLAWFCTFRCAW